MFFFFWCLIKEMSDPLSSQTLFVDSRSSNSLNRSRIEILANVNSPVGTHMRISLLEFTTKAVGQLEGTSDPDVRTILVELNGLALQSKQTHLMPKGAPPNPELRQSNIIAKIPVVKGQDFVQFYTNDMDICSSRLTSTNIGTIGITLTDADSTPLDDPVKYPSTSGNWKKDLGEAGAAFFSCVLRVDIIEDNLSAPNLNEPVPRESPLDVVPSFLHSDAAPRQYRS